MQNGFDNGKLENTLKYIQTQNHYLNPKLRISKKIIFHLLDTPMLPRISLITTTFNSAATIANTLDSALAQTYDDFEHIIIDNQSKDKTLSIVESYRPNYISKGVGLKVFSQKDNGIYDGMNKGLEKAQGEIVGFLNADDFFASNQVLEFIAWGFMINRILLILCMQILCMFHTH